MSSEALQRFVDGARHLPALPTVLARLVEIINDPDSTVEEMEKLLLSDQSLSAHLLKLANSVFFGMSGKVGTIRRAVILLGFKTIRSMALTIWTQSLEEGSRSMLERSLQAEMFSHSLSTAVAASTLATRVSRVMADDCFVGGLLHDIGRSALIAEAGEWYDEAVLQPAARREWDPAGLEREVWGFDHAELGGHLLASFRLPPVLVDAARRHLEPEVDVERDPQLACVCLGNLVAARVGLRLVVQPQPPPYLEVRRALDLADDAEFERFVDGCEERYQQFLTEIS